MGGETESGGWAAKKPLKQAGETLSWSACTCLQLALGSEAEGALHQVAEGAEALGAHTAETG